MTHPHIQQTEAFLRGVIFNVPQQRGVTTRADLRVTEFTMSGGFHLTAELGRHGLHAIANSQHRHTEFENEFGCTRGF